MLNLIFHSYFAYVGWDTKAFNEPLIFATRTDTLPFEHYAYDMPVLAMRDGGTTPLFQYSIVDVSGFLEGTNWGYSISTNSRKPIFV